MQTNIFHCLIVDNMTDLLREISLQLIRIGLPIIVFVSFIGNSLNIAVLGRYKMRKHACSLYFIALSITNLIYLNTILVISLLNDGYKINLSIQSLILCKLITYFSTLLSTLSPYFIVLASIDRWCASSSSAKRRRCSNVRTAKWSIFIVVLFFSILFLISLIMTDLNINNSVGCHIRGSAIFIQVYTIFQFILFACLAPLLMLVFGCMTIYNVQQHHMMIVTSSYDRRTESQLIRMLLVQVGVQLLLILPLCLVGLILSISNIYRLTSNFYSIFYVCRVIFHISYATPFFLYILSAQTFRKEFIDLILKISPCHNHHRVHIRRHVGISACVQAIT